jgi:hypothetical protein
MFADELVTPGIRVPITVDRELWDEVVAIGREVVWTQTYGETFADAAASRPAGDVRFKAGNPRRILNNKTVVEMPSTMTYNSEAGVVEADGGEWGPVRPEVLNYTVGGRPIVKSWFDYRKANPAGKRTSPLDHIHLDTWPGEWSTEFTDLLTVVTRLVELEPVQAGLLQRALAGPLATTDLLADAGALWPKTRQDRSVHYAPTPDAAPGSLGFGA